jgi:hypothetical protein
LPYNLYVQNDDALDFERKQELLKLREYLDRRRKWEDEISSMEETLADPEYAIDHEAARRRLAAATKLLAMCNELIAVQLEVLNIRDEKAEYEKQLAALND